MILKYSLVGFKVLVNAEDGIEPPFPKQFELDADDICDIKISVVSDGNIDSCYGISCFTPDKDVYKIFVSNQDSRNFLCAVSADYDEFKIICGGYRGKETIAELIMIACYSYMSLRNTLLLHASAVSHNGRAVVFTAPSGTGKTTQAQLWEKYRNAKILNGDKVFLKLDGGVISAWGSPWKGSSPYEINESAPLKAIVVLRQSDGNALRKLSVSEAMELFVPQIFFPNWDAECEQSTLDFLDNLMTNSDICLLNCRPDEQSVDLLCNELFG